MSFSRRRAGSSEALSSSTLTTRRVIRIAAWRRTRSTWRWRANCAGERRSWCARTGARMLVFPQTSTGSVAQYPIRKRRVVRTVVNESPGGLRYKLSDGGAGLLEWRLQFVELTDAEKDALVLLFGTAEARLSKFTFLD